MATDLKIDHVVRSADGTLYRVRYVSPARGEAELAELLTNEYLTLPLAELRRVADPRNNKPPIEGLPPKSERPLCQWCGVELLPMVEHVHNPGRGGLDPRVSRRVFQFWRGYEHSTDTYSAHGKLYRVPLFHSTKCAMAFAGASWRGGFRRTQQVPRGA